MTSIEHLNNSGDISLFNFLNGNRANVYTGSEEKGFVTTGNIGSLLNSSPCYLNKIHTGILLNNRNKTDHTNTFIGRTLPTKNDWIPLKQPQPETPQTYCDIQPLSELLPYYPNTATSEHPHGIPNILLNPNCNMQIGGQPAPQVYGGTTAFINNPNVFNNPYNDIGHELEPYGIAEKNGLRALSQGKNSCEKLGAGLNIPNLDIHKNKHGAYIANPATMHPDFPLYQVGNWTDIQSNNLNFLQEFNNNVGQGCNK